MNPSGNSASEISVDEPSTKRIKLEVAERPLNFAISPEEYDSQSMKKTKVPRDPMSHRIIEKRRRDRMNNCLAELSRLIPPSYLKQGQGRIEKTEIIEMASKLIRNLQNLHNFREMMEKELPPDGGGSNACCQEKFFMGYKECQEELLHYLIETEGVEPKDAFCQRIMTYLDQSSKKFLKTPKVKSVPDIRENDASNMSASNMSVSASCYGQQSRTPTFRGNCISENNMAMINQDEHLRTLLRPTDQMSNMTSGYCSSSDGLTSYGGSSSSSCITLQSVQRDAAEKAASSPSGGSQCSSEQNSSEGSTNTSNNSKDCGKCNVYKFKHNITKRFSEEGKPCHQKSDTLSEDSIENEDQGKKKRALRTDSPGSDSLLYPMSENSSVADSYTGGHKKLKYHSDSGNGGQFDSKQVPLPAFVLHPLGTHYVPVTVHPSHFKSVFKDDIKGSTAYHPISIPVNFCGPSVSIHTQVDQKLICATQEPMEERSSTAQSSKKIF